MSDPTSLDRLHDIVEATPLSLWWPLAPGWWIILGGVTVIVVLVCRHWWRVGRINAYRRTAVAEIEQLKDIKALSAILKRVAMAAYGRKSVAALSGQKWVDFLNDQTPMAIFEKDFAEHIKHAGYGKDEVPKQQAKDLKTTAIFWVKTHEA